MTCRCHTPKGGHPSLLKAGLIVDSLHSLEASKGALGLHRLATIDQFVQHAPVDKTKVPSIVRKSIFTQ